MKKPTCTFSYGGLRLTYNVHVSFFHSYLKEMKKMNNQFLNISEEKNRTKLVRSVANEAL